MPVVKFSSVPISILCVACVLLDFFHCEQRQFLWYKFSHIDNGLVRFLTMKFLYHGTSIPRNQRLQTINNQRKCNWIWNECSLLVVRARVVFCSFTARARIDFLPTQADATSRRGARHFMVPHLRRSPALGAQQVRFGIFSQLSPRSSRFNENVIRLPTRMREH